MSKPFDWTRTNLQRGIGKYSCKAIEKNKDVGYNLMKMWIYKVLNQGTDDFPNSVILRHCIYMCEIINILSLILKEPWSPPRSPCSSPPCSPLTYRSYSYSSQRNGANPQLSKFRCYSSTQLCNHTSSFWAFTVKGRKNLPQVRTISVSAAGVMTFSFIQNHFSVFYSFQLETT